MTYKKYLIFLFILLTPLISSAIEFTDPEYDTVPSVNNTTPLNFDYQIEFDYELISSGSDEFDSYNFYITPNSENEWYGTTCNQMGDNGEINGAEFFDLSDYVDLYLPDMTIIGTGVRVYHENLNCDPEALGDHYDFDLEGFQVTSEEISEPDTFTNYDIAQYNMYGILVIITLIVFFATILLFNYK